MAGENKHVLSYTAAQIDEAIGKVVNGELVPTMRTINGKPLVGDITLTVDDIGQGIQGKDGKSAYEVAVANGFIGTEAQWLASLKGKNGTDGADGKDGAQGKKGDMIYAFEIGADGVLSVLYADGTAVPPIVLDGDTLYLDTAMIGG